MSSGNVDTKTVEMRFDNSDFEKNAKQSMSTLERLKQALKLDGASAGLKEVERASKKLDFKDFRGNIDKVGKSFNVLETIATGALLRIGMSAADAGIKLAKSLTIDQLAAGWSKYEEKTTAVQTIMANLRDTEGEFVDEASKLEYVEKYLDKLLWFSDETSYSFTDMTTNVGKFISNGQGLEESVTAMQGIATWAAISGQNSQAAARAMYNISQAMGVGSMKVKDWMSIENAGMATAQFKELAIAIAQKKGLIQEGEVTIENFRDSLTRRGKDDWFNKEVMLETFETYGEAATKIQDYVRKTGTTATSVIRAIRDGNEKIAKEVGVTADSIGFKALEAAQAAKTFKDVVLATQDAVSTKWMQIFQNIFGNFIEAKELWSNLADDMWEIFAAPLDTLNEIMESWNKGFLANGPQNVIQKWFDEGRLNAVENGLKYVSKEAALAAVAADEANYYIKTLEDGTQRLYKITTDSSGKIVHSYKTIYDADKDLLSGRTMLIEGFTNLFNTFIHDVYDEDDNLTSMSIFGSIKRGLLEVIWGTSEADELVPKLSKKLWDLTKAFKELTERLKPSLETSEKIKNAFKGLFTLFKIGGKFVKAIIKPFKEFFGELFKDAPKNLLDLADSMGTWIQKLDQFLDENKTFDTVSNGIKNGLNKIKEGVDWLSQSLTGMSAKDLGKEIKDKVFGFFTNYDFQGTFSKVINFFKDTFAQIKAVNTEKLPEKLTPLQNFWLGFKSIFEAMKKFFTLISPAFKWVGNFVKGVITGISDAVGDKKTSDRISRFQPIWDGIKHIFEGLGDFFEKVGPTIEKVGTGIGDFFRDLGDGISSWAEDKDPIEIIEKIVKGGFLISLTNFINSLAGLNKAGGKIGKFIASDLEEIGGVLKAYQRELNISTLADLALAILLIAGSMWVLSEIPAERLESVGKAMAIIAGALAGFSLLKDLFNIFTNLSWKTTPGNKISDGPLGALKSLITVTIRDSIFANDATMKFVKICLGIALAAAGAWLLVNAVSKAADAIKQLAAIPDADLKKGGQAVGQIIAAFAIFSLFSSLHISGTSGLWSALGALILVKAVTTLADYMAELGKDQSRMDNIKKVVDMVKGMFENAKEIAKIVLKLAIIMAVIQAVVAAFSAGKVGSTLGIARVMAQFGKNFIRIALSLVIVGLAFMLMARTLTTYKIDESQFNDIVNLFGNFITAVGVMLLLIGLMTAIPRRTQTRDMSGPLKQVGNSFMKVAGSLVIVAIAFKIMASVLSENKISESQFNDIVNLFGNFITAVGVILLLTGLMAAIPRRTKTRDMSGPLKEVGNSFLKIAGSLAIVAGAFWLMGKVIGSMDPKTFNQSRVIFGAFIVAVGLITVLVSGLAAKHPGNGVALAIGAMGLAFVAIAASLVIVAAAFKVMASIPFEEGEMDQIMKIFGIFAAISAGLVILGAAIGGFFKDSHMRIMDGIIAVGAIMVAAAISIGIVALAFAALASQTSVEQLQEIKDILIVFGIVVAVLAGIGMIAGTFGGFKAVSGMYAIAVIILAIGAACLMAAGGIAIIVLAFGLFSDGLANLIESIALYGPEFVDNVDAVLKAALLAIINNADLFADAAEALVIAIGTGIFRGIKTVGEKIKEKISAFWDQVKESFNYEVDEHGIRIDEGVEINGNVDDSDLTGRLDEIKTKIQTEADKAAAKVEVPVEVKPSPEVTPEVKTEAKTAAESTVEAVKKEVESAVEDAVSSSDSGENLLNTLIDKYTSGGGVGAASGALGQKLTLTSLLGEGFSIEGLTDGNLELSKFLDVKNIDMTNLSTMFGEGFSGMFADLDFKKYGIDSITDLFSGMTQATEEQGASTSEQVVNTISQPLAEEAANGTTYGNDLIMNMAGGIESAKPFLEKVITGVAEMIHSIIGFSEPERGPLSDFHTYAPDMIKLWNKGVYDNLGSVEDSSTSFGETIYDGFSTALDYVSDLIDNGMSDQLTIRPIMDLSEIQNGVDSMTGMINSANGYQISGTTRLAASAAYGMAPASIAPVDQAVVAQADVGPTNNTFYITSSDPDLVANKVSKILSAQTRRQKAVWDK